MGQISFIAGLTLLVPRLVHSTAFDSFNAMGLLLGLWAAIRLAGAPAVRFNPPRAWLSYALLSLVGGLLLSFLDLKALGAWENPALTGNYALLHASIQAHDPMGTSLLILPPCLFYPILEESLFRGMLYQAFLRAGRSRAASVALGSGLFALMHLTGGLEAVAVLDIFVLGVILSQLTLRSRSLVPAILMHASFNALAVAVRTRLL
ncbi:CPBP family intramembrane glutamic endopeptidase [Mesoterricola silvestris]|uniref:CAAX prenyl protease 2/Lysostaphin resistance protein A-like domain-containing protein n=1 Tax=Mesoterricola silvestris TaxID=2927979 RepID=A0AA48GQ54_9BACT|nr:CPBP family intramembrane glutamic endopeptidase [Mesoterricola silvestris]BDU74069.1 hypothetical protein METEAL_32430 [Mesoterricola silvestris]